MDKSGRTVLRGGSGIFYGTTISNSIGDQAALGFSTSASFVVSQAATPSAFLVRNGFPAYSRPALIDAFDTVPVGTRPTTAVSYFDPHQLAPTSYQTNLDLQHEIGSGLLLEKTIPLTERVRLVVRAQASNLLNRANFSIPGFTLGAVDFGVISSARPSRTVQLGARLLF